MRLLVCIFAWLSFFAGSGSARTALTADMSTTLTPSDSIQATIDDAYTNYDWAGKNVTITLSCGIYFQSFKVSGVAVGQTGNSTFTIQGGDLTRTNPTCVVIMATANNPVVDACVVTNGAVVTLVGIQCQTVGLNAIVCAKEAICTMSFMGAGIASQNLLAVQNGAKLYYTSTETAINGGRTKFYAQASAVAARYVTNPGSDMLFLNVDIVFGASLSYTYIVAFAANSYWHDVNVTYNTMAVGGLKFRGYNHAGYSDGGNGLTTLGNIPGTGYTIFGCASYNDAVPIC